MDEGGCPPGRFNSMYKAFNEVDMFGEQQGGCPGWGRGGKGVMEGNEDGDPSGPGLSYESYSACNEEPWSGSSQGVT